MDIDVQPGRYVIAVSGGVDSMALLHALHAHPGVELIVAHFDHGIRSDSSIDADLVRAAAVSYDLAFDSEMGGLGPNASEAQARTARYDYLERVRVAHQAAAIITAHHQDDVLETAILNLLRGTGRKGLTALSTHHRVFRPILHIPKNELRDYAAANSLLWREDSTNSDEKYLRNYIRKRMLPRFDAAARSRLLAIIEHMRVTNHDLDVQLADLLHQQPHAGALDRRAFVSLPHAVSKELLASWLRARGVTTFDAKILERVTVAAKTFAPGSIIDIVAGARLRVTRDRLALEY